jgi:hypothetical protein
MLIVLVLVGRSASSVLANVPPPVFPAASGTGNDLVVTLPIEALSLDPLGKRPGKHAVYFPLTVDALVSLTAAQAFCGDVVRMQPIAIVERYHLNDVRGNSRSRRRREIVDELACIVPQQILQGLDLIGIPL